MDLGITGKTALVTGASTGLGLAIAQRLVHEGANVAVASRSRERIDAAAARIGAHGFVHDVADPDGAAQLVDDVADRFGPVDILVLSAGGPPRVDDALGADPTQWEAAYRLLVRGPLALVEAVAPPMRERGWGRILGVSSSAVREPIDPLVLSSSHRAALVAAFKTIARQLAPHGVTVNSILPGRIATDRIVDNYGSLERAEQLAATEIPIGRLGTPDEFAATAAFLCSAPAAYVTGTTLLVDGGLTRAV